MYPDCVGDVDIISDAENIKKLLKIPYTKSPVSMFIHRVGKSLLIDDFDIYKTFTKTQNDLVPWLHDFVLNHLSVKAIQDGRQLYAQDRSREALQNRNLNSKFIYRSLGPQVNNRMIEDETNQPHSSRSGEHLVLPNPSPEFEAPGSSFNDTHNRTVVWTFEDIEMLLGELKFKH